MITIIAAIGKNGEIGKDGKLPWHIPEDLSFFKKETIGGSLIMGRKTWESLPGILPSRTNIVVTSNISHSGQGERRFPNFYDALEYGYSVSNRVYAIGGVSIFEEAYNAGAERLLLTSTGITVKDADTYFPDHIKGRYECNGIKFLVENNDEIYVSEYFRR